MECSKQYYQLGIQFYQIYHKHHRQKASGETYPRKNHKLKDNRRTHHPKQLRLTAQTIHYTTRIGTHTHCTTHLHANMDNDNKIRTKLAAIPTDTPANPH